MNQTYFKQHMDDLVKEYESEECVFNKTSNRRMLEMYLSRMEDCHLKCVLYKYLEGETL